MAKEIQKGDIHWIQQEHKQIRTHKRRKQSPMLICASPHRSSPINTNLEPNCQETDNHNRIPDPTALIMRECSRQSGREHDQIRGDSNDKIRTAQPSQKGHVDENEGRGNDPV